MHIHSFKNLAGKALAIVTLAGVGIASGLVSTQAVSANTCDPDVRKLARTIEITAPVSPVTVGVPTPFDHVDQGFKGGGKTHLWDFDVGNVYSPGPTPATSTDASGTVTFNAIGNYMISLTADSSKSGPCTDTVQVMVVDGGGNTSPVLDPIGDKNVPEGGTLAFQVTARDDDGDPITLTTSQLPAGASFTDNGNGTGDFSWPNASPANNYQVTFTASDDFNPPGTDSETVTITVTPAGGNTPPTAIDQTFPIDTAVLDRDGPDGIPGNAEVPAPGVLLNATDPDGDQLTAVLVDDVTAGTLVLSGDGSFSYTPNSGTTTDSFTYLANDGQQDSQTRTVDLTVQTSLEVNQGQNQFAIMMNYELGMHCTGFEFAYCCVLPPYNSILAQVVRTDKGTNDQDFPVLLEGDPNIGKDAVLQRETVVRDKALDPDTGEFKKYVLRYWHEAQPRNDGRGKPQTSTLISAIELNSMLMWNTLYDKTDDSAGPLKLGSYNNATNVPIGNEIADEGGYANGWLNHLYLYVSPDDPVTGAPGHPNLEGEGATGLEANKIRLGIDVPIPTDCGPSGQPMGPVTTDPADPNNTVPNDCGGLANGNLLTFSTDSGTIVYTQAKVLEDLPIYLTSPRVWEALGLPLTPFEDSIDFFGDPGLVDEDSIRPYVEMKAALHEYDPTDVDFSDDDAIGVGAPVLDNGLPVIGFGTAPIDIPNCERCHSVESPDLLTSPNAANLDYATAEANTILEKSFWDAYYDIDTFAGDSDWYSRLKAAALSMLTIHDEQNSTRFTMGGAGDGWTGSPYPACTINGNNCGPLPQNTRLGHESVICQKCHADNVIAVVKSADGATGLIPPVTEAIHNNHRNVTEMDAFGDMGPIVFNDSKGRDGGCQGCHPAHRSDGDMDGYPITEDGNNFYKDGDNRLANGGCFVGRDVHSNPMKDIDGAETPEHLNAVGEYLAGSDVATDSGDWRGIWCTNCHTQLSQEIWKAEDCHDLINGDCVVNPRAAQTLGDLADMLDTTEAQVKSWLDPKTTNDVDDTHRIWDPTQLDAFAVTAEVDGAGNPQGTVDADGNFSVNILSFCTTDDCEDTIRANKGNEDLWRYPEKGAVDGTKGFLNTANTTKRFGFNVATDGRDHWLSPGEPHCGDCHAAPYTEQSGNNNPFAPFNYPAKASLMRYSRGHQDITCQGCHESIHGLYPVTPTIDTTSYAQAANLNADGSHGPLKCGSCHEVNSNGIPTWMQGVAYNGKRIRNFDDAVSWAHTFTDEATVLGPGEVCENCHNDRSNKISETSGKWLRHTFVDRVGRQLQDKAEIEYLGWVAGDPDGDRNEDGQPDNLTPQEIADTVCTSCHELNGGPSGGFLGLVGQCGTTWKQHLTEGRVAEKVWSFITDAQGGVTCGW